MNRTGGSSRRVVRFRISLPVRVLVYLVAALIVMYLAMVATLRTAWFNHLLLERTRAAMEKVTGARVEVASLTISPWAFQATFRGLVLRGDEAPPELPLFEARQLVVQISPRAALHWRLRLRRVDLEGAQVHLYTRPDGSTNLPGPAAAAGGASSAMDDLLDLGIGRLVVGGSSASWDNRQWPLDVSARDVSVVLGFRNAQCSGSISATAVNVSNPSFNLPPTTFAARVELARNRLSLNSLVWRSVAMNGSGSAALHWEPALASEFSFQVEGDVRPLAGILHQPAVRGGQFSARGQGAYRDGIVTARGRLDAHRLLLRTPEFRPPPVELGADYSLSGARAELTRLRLSALGGTASGSVAITFGPRTPAFKASLRIEHVDLAQGLRSVPAAPVVLSNFPLAGRVDGELQLSGGPRSARAGFDITIEAAPPAPGIDSVSGYARGSAALIPSLAVTLDDARLQSAASTLVLRGTLGQTANLTLQVRTTSFDEWRAPAELLFEAPIPLVLHSTATFSGTLTGTPAEPLVRGALEAGDFELRGSKWNGLRANVSASPRQIQVSSARLTGSGNTLNFDVTAALQNWQLVPSSRITIAAEAQNTSIEGLREVLNAGYPVTGRLTGNLKLDGTRQSLTGQGALHVTRGSYDGEAFDSLDAALSIQTGAWKVTQFHLVKGHGSARGEASFDPHSNALSARVEGSGFQLADFTRLGAAGLLVGPGGDVAGTLSFSLQAGGDISNPAGNASVQLRHISVSGVALGALTGQVDLKNGRATLAAQLQGAGGTIDLHASATTSGNWPVEVKAQYSGLRLDPWLREAGFSKVAAELEASGAVQGAAALRKSRSFQLTSDVQKLDVSLADLKWRNNAPFQVSLTDRKATLSAFELVGPSTHFQIQGSADLGEPSSVSLTADGQIDATILHAFDPAILTVGLFRVQLKAQGPLRDPSLFGDLHVDNLSLGYPGLPIRLANLTGDIDLQGDRVVIRSLQSSGGPATVRFTGGATLYGEPRFNVRAELQHVRVDFPVEFTSVLSGSLRLNGTLQAAALSGDLTVEQMYVAENFNLLNWLNELENQPMPGLAGGPAPLSSRVRLDVHIGTSPTVGVESHDLTASASVDLSLRGSLADPVAYGNVHILNGTAVVRQTTYTLSRGDVTMANPLRTAPTLDIEAKTRIESHDLVLRLSGPADRPNISYRSDPPLPGPDILALLAFGYTSQNQLMGANGRSSLGTQSAGAILSQALSSRTSSRITRLFGLSRISIDPNPSSLGGARVTVAEQLARNFTVTYVTTTGGVYERIISVEWNVTENISVLGIRDQNGVFGLELDFRHRFK